MNKVKLVVKTKDTEYEFVGNQVPTHGTDVLFRSHEPDNSVIIGEIRFIYNEIHYCSESMMAIDGTFYYWTPVETINKHYIVQSLIKDLQKES